jgi:predicted dehydrogenase
MARTLVECDEMIEACDNAGVTLMVGFMKRYDKSMVHAKQLLDEGRLGTPLQVLCDWRGQQPGGRRWEIRERAFSSINAVYLSAYLGEKVHLPLESTPDLERIFAEMKARSPR